MRRHLAFPIALAMTLCAWISPALALERPPAAPAFEGTVVRIADLDRPAGARRLHRANAYAHWRYRAGYIRWLHNEYVVAGYPVNQYRSPTYYWVGACCHYYRRW
jgi:hypothetical protein